MVQKQRMGFLLAVIGLISVIAFAEDSVGRDASYKSKSWDSRKAKGIVVEELVQGMQLGPVNVHVDGGGVQVNIRKITIPPNGTTGLHCHYGQVIGVVQQGTLTLRAPIFPTRVHEYRAGESIVEGRGYIHEGRNEDASVDVVLWAVYITPAGKPLAETDHSRCKQTDVFGNN
ncbi:uncharacterized protein ATNIH1004_005354 [Aspergillus tanneri]|uniref:Cupin 2 conserved barrel domain-containing protein n=1 Tax=Aspergillus tanneri TaxID=1220188 RepID=A0A5M9MQ59_9EURO|nr:uncharacterized protein ATNIH1004_005354 [Aspergillus tanneri]KAA8646679.1 hypothetical protein ATNIH1004_005354 [Aspergillus tanneri]